jgi:NAD(P)-dependent dehydrogenase (short-subunit alcohol dehydrogenase family)
VESIEPQTEPCAAAGAGACILDPLERRGLVRIEPGRVDQRERVAQLTAAGQAAIDAAGVIDVLICNAGRV